MRTRFLVLSLIGAISSWSGTEAQTVTVSGKLFVPFNPPAVACGMPVNALQFEGTDVYLTSQTITLMPFIGADVQVTGTLVGANCTLVDVASIGAAPYVVETCGGGALNCGARINLKGPGGGVFGLFIGLDGGFFPSSVAGGTFLLDPATSILAAIAPEPGPTTTFDVLIPVDPALFALTFRLQAVRQGPPLPGVLQWSTLDTIFTGTFTTPCHGTQC